MRHWIPPHAMSRSSGFSLVELMVAIAIGLLIIAGLAGVFVNTNATQSEIEKSNRQIENGRFAVQLLTDDLRMAGFYGEFNPTELDSPATLPDICATAPADLIAALPLHVQGIDNEGGLACLPGIRAGTDILVVRRTETCIAGSGGCDAVDAALPYFQASMCNNVTELGSPTVTDRFTLALGTSGTARHKRDCTTGADRRRFRVHIYFIAESDTGTDGRPTLKRAELGAGGFSVVPLVEGIENLQVEYGMDTNNDGSPDVYHPAPGSYDGCSGSTCIDNWRNVVAVKTWLLARNNQPTPGYSDAKKYVLGTDAEGEENAVGPLGDSYKRHAYEALIRLINPSGRREL